MPEHKLIVGQFSPFSDKAQAISRYKGIPFERIENKVGGSLGSEDRAVIDALIRWPS